MCRQKVVRRMLLACTVPAMLACGRRDAPPRDTLPARPRETVTPGDSSDWASELGPLLVVPSDSDHTGVVLFPATPSARLIASAPLTLLSASGDSAVTRASLVVSDSQVCGEAPTVRLN